MAMALALDVVVDVVEHDGAWSAVPLNFPVLAYGVSAMEALQRALGATTLLLKRKHGQGTLHEYLSRRGVQVEHVPAPVTAAPQRYSSKVLVCA